MPPAPDYVNGEVTYFNDKSAAAGFGIWKIVDITFATNGKSFTFPTTIMLPKGVENPPLVVFSYFGENGFREYIPAEQLIDSGVAFAWDKYISEEKTRAELISEWKASLSSWVKRFWGYT